MPTDWQSIVVYLIVLVTVGAIVRHLFFRREKSHTPPACSKDCGCGVVRRDPAIQQFIDRRKDEAP